MSDVLPSFPVDDVTLDALEHALGAAITYVDNEPTLVGAEYDLHQLLDFLSGYDPTQIKVLEEGLYDGDPPRVTEYVGGVIYTPNCVIRALIAEVRRLRERASDG